MEPVCSFISDNRSIFRQAFASKLVFHLWRPFFCWFTVSLTLLSAAFRQPCPTFALLSLDFDWSLLPRISGLSRFSPAATGYMHSMTLYAVSFLHNTFPHYTRPEASCISELSGYYTIRSSISAWFSFSFYFSSRWLFIYDISRPLRSLSSDAASIYTVIHIFSSDSGHFSTLFAVTTIAIISACWLSEDISGHRHFIDKLSWCSMYAVLHASWWPNNICDSFFGNFISIPGLGGIHFIGLALMAFWLSLSDVDIDFQFLFSIFLLSIIFSHFQSQRCRCAASSIMPYRRDALVIYARLDAYHSLPASHYCWLSHVMIIYFAVFRWLAKYYWDISFVCFFVYSTHAGIRAPCHDITEML